MRSKHEGRRHASIVIALLVGAYIVTALIGRFLSYSAADIPLIWLPPGVGLAVILLLGFRRWPFVLAATFLAHWALSRAGEVSPHLSGHSLWVVIAAGDAVAAFAGAYFSRRPARTGDPCLCTQDFLRFAAFAAGGAGALGAAVVAAGFAVAGAAGSDGLVSLWLKWWLAYALGIVTMTPLLVTWYRDRHVHWRRLRALEGLVPFSFLAVLSYLILAGGTAAVTPAWHMLLPVLGAVLWYAIRFGRRETAAGVFILALLTGWAVVAGRMPFGDESVARSALWAQIALGVLSVSTVGLVTGMDDRRRSKRKVDMYRLAALQTADHWMITDVNGFVVEVNPAFEKVTGYSQAELFGKRPNVIKSGIHSKSFYEDMWRTILSGEAYKGIVVNRRRNGELFHEIKSITPIKDETGRITHFFSIGKDITDLRQAEEDLRKSASELEQTNQRLSSSEADLLRHIRILESVLSSSNEGVIVADRDGRFLMFSEAAREMIGIGAVEGDPSVWTASYGVYMKDGKTPFPTDDLPLVRAIKGDVTNDVELFIRNPDKPDGVWLSVSGRPLRDAAGDIIGGVIVARDITQDRWVKRASEELRATREEMGIAERIQKRFFPRTPPVAEDLDIGGASRPAVVTGGDYFDYIRNPDQSLLLVVGDVSGHGFGPALLMASVRAYMHALAASGVPARDMLSVVNRLITADTRVGDFVTLLIVHLDPRNRFCEYASAGHPTGYLLDRAGRVKQLLSSSVPPLGILPELVPGGMSAFELEDGDLLIMVTDGLLEAENGDGEPFGEERVMKIVCDNRLSRASEIVDILHKAVSDYCGGKLQDDITSIVFKYRPDGQAQE